MPLTPDPYETALDAGQGIEGNENRPNSHEGTDLMTNPTAIADALATIIALLTAYNRDVACQGDGTTWLPEGRDHRGALLRML
ncbi:hypothetical protein R3P93_09320, partial [Rhodococcus cerastii]